MKTPKCILSFPHLITPSGFDDRPKTYNCNLLMDKKAQATPEYKALNEAIIAAAKAKFGDKVNLNNIRMPIKNGDDKDYAGYAGCVYMTVKNERKPGYVDENVEPLLDLDRIFPGAFVIADISVSAYDKGLNKGVSLYLNHMQFLKGGERLDGKASATSIFTPEDDDDNSPF